MGKKYFTFLNIWMKWLSIVKKSIFELNGWMMQYWQIYMLLILRFQSQQLPIMVEKHHHGTDYATGIRLNTWEDLGYKRSPVTLANGSRLKWALHINRKSKGNISKIEKRERENEFNKPKTEISILSIISPNG